MRKVWHVALGIAVATGGCSQGSARIAAPNIDPESAADAALELYDADSDGSLSKVELSACPAVLANLSIYDQNGDGLVSRDEFVARLNELYGKRVGLSQMASQVSLQGRPLADAVVVFEPEPYLGDEIMAADGKTDSNGSAPMSIAPEFIPENLRQRHMRLSSSGTYRVRSTHPTVNLPAKYNVSTTLGYESQFGSPVAKFELSAK
jgi:hypothetical protein